MAKIQGNIQDLRLILIEAKVNSIMHALNLDEQRKELDAYYTPRIMELKGKAEAMMPEAEIQKLLKMGDE